MKRIIASTLAVIAFFVALGQKEADTVRVYFSINEGRYDASRGDNAELMDCFISRLRAALGAGQLDHVAVSGYASPEGSLSINEPLSLRRAREVSAYISRNGGVGSDKIQLRAEGEAWEELKHLVETESGVPDREKILDVLNDASLIKYAPDGTLVDLRKSMLRTVGGGESYRWMLENLYPRLRYVSAVSYYNVSGDDGQAADASVLVEEAQVPAEAVLDGEPRASAEAVAGDLTESSQKRSFLPLALKTNMLYYAALMPNLEVEWHFRDRWSVALEGQSAWYAKENPHKVYRLATVMPELRYWVINRSRFHGMYVGVFGGAAWYDLCNGKKGHEGEGGLGGVSVGYMWPISKYLSLEAGIGVGYMRLRDKVYVPMDGHYLYQLTKNINYFGPLRVKFSLVWRLPGK
ncbi:MAG: DUF3575 domain-containing protein [Muribaculaceae bacterium]|nr:DUF3575 domain-containing protein [Muribaculaceae bacterium]